MVFHTKLIIRGLILITCLVTSTAHAETPPSQFSIERGVDSDEGTDYFLALELGIRKIQLGLAYGESEYLLDGVTQDTSTIEFSLGSDPLNTFAMAVSYAEWGQAQEMEIQTGRVDFTLNTDDWLFSLAPQTRNIKIYWLDKSRAPIEIDSDGINLGVAFYGIDRWSVGIDYSRNDYSRDVTFLASDSLLARLLALRLSPASLSHTFGLEEERVSADIGYMFSRATLGLVVLRSTSAVDQAITTSRSVYLSYSFDDDWQLDLEAGVSENSLATDQTRFGVAGLSYHW